MLLWKKQQRAAYRTNPATGEMVLDPTNSDISEAAMEKIYMADVLKRSDILQFNFDQLKALATGKNRKQKEWLREFLSHCDESPEKQALQQMLDH
jgi:hypothetical protein